MKYPYYIVAPRYIRTSAGVRVLYKLCDLINKEGGSAFIYLKPYCNHDLASSPMDVAPFLTKKIADYHFANGLTPIVIYPETIDVSNLNATLRVRYLLNYQDLLFQNAPLDRDDYLLAYSDSIFQKIQAARPKSTLNLPISDPVFFCPPKIEQRSGGVFYAGKYKYFFKGKTFPITEGMPEITRDRPDSQTPEQIRDLFQKSEFFYCYEDSMLVLEAMLCGCPVVLLPSEHYTAPLGKKELGDVGYAWGASEEQLQHAKATIHLARQRYLDLQQEAIVALKEFLSASQTIAAQAAYPHRFAARQLRAPNVLQQALDIFLFLKDVIADKGWVATFNIVRKRLQAKRFKLF